MSDQSLYEVGFAGESLTGVLRILVTSKMEAIAKASRLDAKGYTGEKLRAIERPNFWIRGETSIDG